MEIHGWSMGQETEIHVAKKDVCSPLKVDSQALKQILDDYRAPQTLGANGGQPPYFWEDDWSNNFGQENGDLSGG